MSVDFTMAILTFIAVIVPFVIPWIEKRDKLKKTVYLIELIKTKEELLKLISQVNENDGSVILVEKLKNNLNEIESNINSTKNRFQMEMGGFVIIISIEIFFIFSYMSHIILEKSYKSGLLFLEGVFNSPISRIILILLVIIMAFASTIYLSKKIQLKTIIKNLFFYNVSMFVIFNIILLFSGILTYFFLKYSDGIIPWY